jgi:hypothetical protein
VEAAPKARTVYPFSDGQAATWPLCACGHLVSWLRISANPHAEWKIPFPRAKEIGGDVTPYSLFTSARAMQIITFRTCKVMIPPYPAEDDYATSQSHDSEDQK